VKTLPLYAYRCTQCGHKFEKIQKFSSKQLFVCPKCGGVLERPLTAPAFNFKGAGWYVNDYGGGKDAAPEHASAPAETKAPAAPVAAAPASPAPTSTDSSTASTS
jgi:putative FmdB family regulatory protein